MEQFGIVFDYGLRADTLRKQHEAEQLALQQQRDSKNPYKIFTAKERFEHYWLNYKWQHPYDVVSKFGINSKHHGFILPTFFRAIYNREVSKMARRTRRYVEPFNKKQAHNNFACLEVEPDCGTYVPEVSELVTFGRPIARKIHRKRAVCRDFHLLERYLSKCEFAPRVRKVRDEFLLVKLRVAILQLRMKRSPAMREHCEYMIERLCDALRPIHAQPEGDVVESVEGKNELNTDSAGNVTISHQEDISAAITAPTEMNWSQLTTCDTVSSYSDITDRWYNLGSYEWTTSQLIGADICTTTRVINNKPDKRHIILPLDIVHSSGEDPCNMPNLMPFRVNAYWRGDMVVKLQVNSNKFQVGALQMTFIPQAAAIEYVSLRQNVYTLSQLPHAIVMASASNEAELTIPYSHPYPYMPCRPITDYTTDRAVLNMGTLYVKVLNPLNTVDNGPDSCNVSIYVKFINNTFTGLSHGSLFKYPTEVLHAQPEMDVFTIQNAMRLLDTVASNDNRDLPPVNVDPMYVVPTASHSWCVGTGQPHHNHILRLDSRGQTHHPRESAVVEQMHVNNIATKYGLVDQFAWHGPSESRRGVLLASYDATPFISHRLSGKGYETVSSYAPVGSVASLFMQWRGTLEFKFQFIASQFHTGRIVVGYVPGADANTHMTLNALRASTHVVFDLQESREFVFEVPYISYKPWFARSMAGNYAAAAQSAPSRIYVYVLNPLINMPSLPDAVEVNVYLRAGKSFEVSVPVQQSLGLSINSDFKFANDEVVHAAGGYSPYYADTWHSVLNGTGFVMRWGKLSDQVAQFTDPHYPKEANVAYYFQIQEASLAPKYGNNVPIEFMVMHSMGDYWISLTAASEEDAKAMAIALQLNKLDVNNAKVVSYSIHGVTIPANPYCIGNPTWVRRAVTKPPIVSLHPLPEGEEVKAVNVISAPSSIMSTQHGKYLYGEDFSDLRNLARRYQFYGKVYLGDTKTWDGNKCLFYFPALPQGLKLDVGTSSQINELSNRCREGHIPYLASAFRYYRGGLRFKIIMPTEVNTMVWVQHRPDRKLDIQNISKCTDIESAQGIWNHTYASYLQFTRVNNIIEFEVPFYNPTVYNFLQNLPAGIDTAFKWAISLGEIGIGCQLANEDLNALKNKEVMIYYALADDCAFTHWIGFPPMYKLDTIPYHVQPEGPAIEKIINAVAGKAKQEIKDKVVEESKETIKSEFKIIQDIVTNKLQSCNIEIDPSHISTVISQVGHAILNPTWQTIAWCVVSILIMLGMMTVGLSKVAFAACGECIKAIWNLFSFSKQASPKKKETESEPSTSEQPIHVQAEGPPVMNKNVAERCAEWVGLLYNGLVTSMGLAVAKPKNLSQWTQFLVRDVGMNARSSNMVILFIKNTFDCMKSMVMYILGKTDKTHKTLQALEASPDLVKAWAKEVAYLTDPKVKNERLGTYEYNNRVSEASNMAQIIMADLAGDIKTEKNSQALSKFYDKISTLQEELIQLGENPFVRKMPFAVYVCGAPGIGKSFMTTSVMAHMLKAANIKLGAKGMKCTINPLSEFWDQCEHQPVLECDDMWAITTDDALATQLVTLLQVLSPIVLSPPKAALDEKKMRYNPDIMWMSSNREFPKFNNVIPEVIWRRRNVLIFVSLAPVTPSTVRPGCPHCESSTPIDQIEPRWLSDFHHLQFKFHTKVTDPTAPYGPILNYQQFVRQLTREFLEFRIREHENFQKRIAVCEMLNSDYPIMLGDSIEKIYETMNEQRLNNYAKLEAHTLWSDIKAAGMFTVEQAKKMKWWLVGNSAADIPAAYCGPRNDPSIKKNEPPVPKDADMVSAMPLTAAAIKELDSKSSNEEKEHRRKLVEADRLDWEQRVAAMHVQAEGDDIDLAILQKDRTLFERICSVMTGKFCFSLDKADLEKYEIKQLDMLVKADLLLPSEYNRYIYLSKKFDILPANNANFWAHYDVVISRLITKCPHMLTLEKIFKYCHNERPIRIDNTVCDAHLVPYCHHMNYDMLLVVVNADRKLVYENVEIEAPCADRCVYNSAVLKTLWYKYWLERNPMPLMRYRRRQYNTLPAFLGAQNMIDAVSIDNWFTQVINELRGAWLKYVAPPVYNVYRWVCDRMPTIITVMMSLFALGSLGAGSYYTWKAYKDNTALVDQYSNKLDTITTKAGLDKHCNAFVDAAVENESLGQRALIGSAMSAGLSTGLARACYSRSLTSGPLTNVVAPQSINYNIGTPQKFNPSVHSISALHAKAENCSQYDAALKLIEHNAFYIVCMVDDNIIVRFRGLILRARMALFLRHYVEIFMNIRKAQPQARFLFEYAKDHKLRVTANKFIDVNLDAIKSMYFGDNPEGSPVSNFIVINLPNAVPAAKDLINFIATPTSIGITNDTCELITPACRIYSDIRVDFRNTSPIIIDPTHESGEVILVKYYKYPKHAKGLCGSVLISPYSPRPILGMHVAGLEGPNGYGFAEPMFAEQFENLSFGPVDVIKDVKVEELQHVDANACDFRTALVVYGKVAPERAQLQSPHSNIIPSMIHGVFDVRTAPNPLHAGDRRLPPDSCPLIRGCEKHGIQTLSFPANLLKLAQQSLSTKLCQMALPITHDVGVRSYQDAVCGVNGILEFDAMNFTTSAGYPFSRDGGNTRQGKKWLFDLTLNESGYILNAMNASLKARINEDMRDRHNGILPFTVFSDCLKDTTLPLEKNTIPGKTRIFSISPVQFTIPFRQYFMDFMGAYRRNRYFTEHAIGINVNSTDWTYLAGQLTQFGDHIITGDYKNFGPGLNCDVAEAAFACILDWYKEHNTAPNVAIDNQIRAMMAQEIIAPKHLCRDLVYSATAGIPSGSPITDILNSLVNCLYIRVAFLELTLIDLSEFDNYVVLIVYGDDLIMNVKNTIIEKFNAATLQKFFEKYNIVFTDVDKKGEVVISRSISNSTFLKRKFRQHPSKPYHLLAALDIVSVEGCANWIKRSTSPSQATIANALQCCELAYGLGPDEYLRIHSALLIALRKQKLNCILPTWDMLDARIWSMDVKYYVPLPNGDYDENKMYLHVCNQCYMTSFNHISLLGKVVYCINPSCTLYNRKFTNNQILGLLHHTYDVE